MKKFFLLCFITFLFPLLKASAQEIQNDLKAAAANYFTAPGYSISWTLGEAVILTVSDSTISLTQGFQQPKVKKKYIQKDLPKKDNISIGPTPAIDVIEISLDRPIDKNIPLKAEIFDVIGRRLFTQEFHGQKLSVDISREPSGVYFVRVTVAGQEIGVYKFQKVG